MEKRISELTKKYSFSQAFFWIAFMVTMEFSGMYLNGHGINNTLIGILLAISGAISAILQPFFGTLADRPSGKSVKTYLLILICLLIPVSAVLLFHYKQIGLTLLFYGLTIILLQIATTFHNALATESINQGHSLNIGFTRGIASLACGLISFVLGASVERFGVSSLAFCVMIMMLCYLFNIKRFPFSKTTSIPKTKENTDNHGMLFFFNKYPSFSLSLIGCTCLYFSYILMMNFSYQIASSKGANSMQTGIIVGIAALAELPVMFGFYKMMKRKPAGFWVMVSGGFFVIKSFASLLVKTALGLSLIQLFQMFSWALLSLAVVYFVNDCMEEMDKIKGQGYMASTYTIAIVIASLIGGFVIDHFGISCLLIIATIVSGIGTTINIVSIRRL